MATTDRESTTARRDQKRLHDYLVQSTGRATNFNVDAREFPATVKRYTMAPKAMARVGRNKMRLGADAEKHGHVETAHELYWSALRDFHAAQHTIHRDTPQKRFYYDRLVECFDKVVQHTPHEIERIEVPFEGSSIQCLYHPLPGRPRAPLVLYLTGIDVAKEGVIDPLENAFHRRGFHVLVMDPPGMGIARLRGQMLTPGAVEKAGRAVLDHFLQLPEVDADRLGVLGVMPSANWATGLAAGDSRVKALATNNGLYGATQPVFDLTSPRFRWHVMYMMGIDDEDEFDRLARDFTPVGLGPSIHCPALMVISEYDEFVDLEQALAHFESLAGPRELWLMEDEVHRAVRPAGFAGNDLQHSMLDWLRDALNKGLPPDHARVVRIGRAPTGPYGPEATYPFGEAFWY